MNPQLLKDFCLFAKAHIESGDIDPTYPVLKNLYRRRGYAKDTAIWHTLLYVTFYNLDSAEQVFARYSMPTIVSEPLTFPTGIERRGFRGNALANQHVNYMARLFIDKGGADNWVRSVIGSGGERGWNALRQAFQQAPHGGNWSSYKLADLIKHVHDYQITANDIGVGGGSETAGPIPGMVRLTGQPWKRCATDVMLQRQLFLECRDMGVPFNGLDQLETALCDFNSLCKGHYYVGHDIDQQMDQLKSLGPEWWDARQASFPHEYLGELNGWRGVRKELKRRYADTGELVL